jgi:hypothetical protein
MKKHIAFSLLLGLSASGAQASVLKTIKEKVLTKNVLVPTAKIAGGLALIGGAAAAAFGPTVYREQHNPDLKASLAGFVVDGIEVLLFDHAHIKELKAAACTKPVLITAGSALAMLAGGTYLLVDGIRDALKGSKSEPVLKENNKKDRIITLL